jgi:carbamoyl-phosphate synthase large subunit
LSRSTTTVLVAGIAGASLGTEIAKALGRAAIRYRILGCDISPLAFGHYSDYFEKTFLVEPDDYVANLLALCTRERVDAVVPGGDRPMALIAAAKALFAETGVAVAMNSAQIVARCSDKFACSEALASLGFTVPRGTLVADDAAAARQPVPCVVKPNAQGGGSAYVFYAHTRTEVELYARYIRDNGREAVAQEYVPLDGGEFTVGVLSLPNGSVAGAIALKRAFPAKLSIAASGPHFLISSGVTQGHIGSYPAVTQAAIEMAKALGSVGPLNVQGRLDSKGRFVPFEINPRFSASTYLRALAGFNEIDVFLQELLALEGDRTLTVRPGWYLRSLTETHVADGDLVS